MFRARTERPASTGARSALPALGMGLTFTLWLAAACLAAALFAGWRGARPPDLRRGPRLIPWRFLMMLSACGAVVFVVHLLNLLGVNTGRGP